MAPRHPEFPGFSLPGAPIFNGARGGWMFAGTMHEPLAVVDFAMVFGSRLWGHDEVALSSEASAPGVGDLYTHEWRRYAAGMSADAVAAELDEDSVNWRSLILHTGSEAVETAIKTALRASGRIRLHAFEGGYHGTFGLALAVTHDHQFRDPWIAQYGGTATWTPWGTVPELDEDTACVVVEPWQGRAGVIPPPDGFHAALRAECDRVGAALILDAVLCGGGRTGAELAACLSEAKPDIVCLGKAIGCGAVASVVVARNELVEAAWDKGPVEPAHTSTHIGDPAACAGIVRSLRALVKHADSITQTSQKWQDALASIASQSKLKTRGRGLLWAIDTEQIAGGLNLASKLLSEHRILVVPSGKNSSSITLYPSMEASDDERRRFVEAVLQISA